MIKKKYLILRDDDMSFYTLDDIHDMNNVKIIHWNNVHKNRLVRLLFNIHNSRKIKTFCELPFKGIWDRVLFNDLLKSFTPDYIVISVSWYSNHLLRYFRFKCNGCKIIYRFSDTIFNGLGTKYYETLKQINSQCDGILVYNKEDSRELGYKYHSVGYSAINTNLLIPCKSYDVVFIGAEKGRMNKIRQAYNTFQSVGLSCFFYVTLVDKKDRMDDGIIYADKGMPFIEYLSYEVASKCIFELVQDGTSGRTYRMMESIIYNKLLVTNCKEIVDTDYFRPQYVQLFNDVSEIDPSFVVNSPSSVDYNYKGDFSPIKVLSFIEKNW